MKLGADDWTIHIQTEENKENETELKLYDAKVHKASVDMSRAMESELRNLGIPFFAIRSSLIAPVVGEETNKEEKNGKDKPLLSSSIQTPTPTAERRDTVMISRADLVTLQRRMLELLQDLCKD